MLIPLLILRAIAASPDVMGDVTVGGALAPGSWSEVTDWKPTSPAVKAYERNGTWAGMNGRFEVEVCANGKVQSVAFSVDVDPASNVAAKFESALVADGWVRGDEQHAGSAPATDTTYTKNGATRHLIAGMIDQVELRGADASACQR